MLPPNASERSYYDSIVARQLEKAFNDRHLFLHERLSSLGIRADARILEVGCGIGVMTFLVRPLVPQGQIISIDSSEDSIAMARRINHAATNVNFIVGRIQDLGNSLAGRFDLILLLDVLEHIPCSEHQAVLQILRAKVAESGRLLVNIPSAGYNSYLRASSPTDLQPIDEILEADKVVGTFSAAGFDLLALQTYGIWLQDQYQLFLFRPCAPFQGHPLPPPTFPSRLKASLHRRLRRIQLSWALRHA